MRCWLTLISTALSLLPGLSISSAGAGTTFSPDLHIGYQGEKGTLARGVIGGGASVGLNPWLQVAGGLSLSLFQHNGVSAYGLHAGITPPALERLNVKIGLQHEQWQDWRAGENRLFSTVLFLPAPALQLGIGICRRYPIYDSIRFRQPWLWRSPVPEWNLIYHLEWKFFASAGFSASLGMNNLPGLTFYNPQQFPAYLNASYQTGPGWRVFVRGLTAINGFSTGLISLSGVEAIIGVRYEK